MRTFLYPLLIFLFIMSQFVQIPSLTYIIGGVSVITLFVSCYYASGLYLISGIIFSFIGIVIFIFTDQPFTSLFIHFGSMLGILGMFLLLPFLNSLIKVGNYDSKLRKYIEQGVNGIPKLYRRSFLVCHFLGLFLNIGTLPLLTKSLNKTLRNLPKKVTDQFYTQNLLRGYALCLTWSPMEIMVITSLDITGRNYLQLFPLAIAVLLLVVIIDWIRATYSYKNISFSYESPNNLSNKELFRNISELLLFLFTLMICVNLFSYIFQKGYLLSIVILILPITVGWSFIIRKSKRFFQLSIPLWKERTKAMANFFFMFLSAGFFVGMLSDSGQLNSLQTIFISISNQTLLFYLSIAIYFLLSSFVGFHPLVSLTLLAELLAPVLTEVSSIYLTLVLICCSLATVLYSPFNVSVSILADSLKINPYRLGMWNLPFALLYIFLGISIALIANLIF